MSNSNNKLPPSPFVYSDVINPIKFTICALDLKPFSLGHYLILEQLDSPFLTDQTDKIVDMEEGMLQFLLCLLICSQDYNQNISMLNDPAEMKYIIKKFGKGFCKSIKRDKHWNIFEKLNLFKQYIKYFTEMPIFQKEHSTSSIPSGIDWKQNLFTLAKTEFGYEDMEILNMPLKRLFYEWCSLAEKNGSIRVQNGIEVEQLRQMGLYR